MELADYDFRIEFIPGKVNDVADALSRLNAAEPSDASQSIEFRDYLRDQEVMSVDLELLMADTVFAADVSTAHDHLQQLGGEDRHLSSWTDFADPVGTDAMLAEVTRQQTLDLSARCNESVYMSDDLRCDVYASVAHSSAGKNAQTKNGGTGESGGQSEEASADAATTSTDNTVSGRKRAPVGGNSEDDDDSSVPDGPPVADTPTTQSPETDAQRERQEQQEALAASLHRAGVLNLYRRSCGLMSKPTSSTGWNCWTVPAWLPPVPL
jgi:hypothetical protein